MVGVKRKISEVNGSESEAIPSVKDLASSEPKLRRHAIQKVISHLESRSPDSPITPTQALQLWRGFHVALYMHDSKSAISVQNLITQLAATFTLIRSKDEEIDARSIQKSTETSEKPTKKPNKKPSPSSTSIQKGEAKDEEWTGFDTTTTTTLSTQSNSEPQSIQSWLQIWSTAFWTTLIREWSSIDSHRMNKYLLLVRTVLREIFTICLKAHFSSLASDPSSVTVEQAKNLIRSQLEIISSHPLEPRDSKVPNGLRLHMLDIYVAELEVAWRGARSSSTTDSTLETVETEVDGDEETPKKEFLGKEMMEPVRKMAKEGLVRTVRIRAKEEVETFEGAES